MSKHEINHNNLISALSQVFGLAIGIQAYQVVAKELKLENTDEHVKKYMEKRSKLK